MQLLQDIYDVGGKLSGDLVDIIALPKIFNAIAAVCILPLIFSCLLLFIFVTFVFLSSHLFILFTFVEGTGGQHQSMDK